MPIGRQSNALFHTLITFVALFLAATTFAVTYYIKAAKQSAAAATAKAQLGELASTREIQEIGSVVGAKQGGKSRFGTMVGYFNETVAAIIGGLPDDNSMENKTAAVKRKIAETFKQIGQEAADINDPNTAGLIPVIEKMKARMDEATALSTDISQQLEDLRARFDDASAANAEKEKTLLEEKQKNQQQVADIAKDYNDLKVLVEQSSEQRIKTLMNQLDEEKTTCKTLNSKLLKTEAELKLAQERIKTIQENLQKVVPPPDSEVAAFKTDGKIMLVDDSTQTVHLNIGSDDHVYKGLTFSVYDRNAPIPKG